MNFDTMIFNTQNNQLHIDYTRAKNCSFGKSLKLNNNRPCACSSVG